MIKSINELNFDKNLTEFINDVEDAFNELSITEGSEMSMFDWINENLEAISEERIMENLTDREKFLFAFGILSSTLEERISGGKY